MKSDGATGIDTGTRGTVYFDGFVSQRESYVGLDGGALPAPSKTDNLFADGFEGNSLAAWSGNTPDSGHLTVTSAAAIFGSKGLNVYINDNNSLYVTDITPFEESHYRAHFHFKPNGITMATNDAHYIFYGLDRSGTVQERIEFGKSSTGYQVRAGVLAGGSWTTTNWVAITNAAHYLETDWQASTASSSPYNGVFTFWVDGTQSGTYTNLNSYGKTIDYVQLGGVSGIDTGTRGTEYIDAFDSHRSSYIGTATSMVPAPENTGSFVMVAYHPDSLPKLVIQPRPSSGGKMASLDQATPSLRLPMTITADQLVGLNIAYTYDPLGRLTGANYSDGSFFHYTYDAVGNRLTQTTALGTVNYVYDDANRLKSLVQGSNTYTYTYNGEGNRVSQILNAGTPTEYVLDQAAGLVQVLSDGSYTYLYGNDRIAQQSASETDYFLTDALGSVRQLVDEEGEITLNRSYDPYGNVLTSSGDGESTFAFTGEQVDSYSNLLNLRSRMYFPGIGRFLTKDSWQGDMNRPMSYNAWLYVYANPIRYTDPTGKYNREDAVRFAMTHDQDKKFPDDGYFDFPSYQDQCTMFVSSALSKGGYPTSGGWPGHEDTKLDAKDPNDSNIFYFNRMLKGENYELAWVNTPQLYHYLETNNDKLVPTTDGSVDFGDDDWIKWLNQNWSTIVPGDVVFYQSEDNKNMQIEWGHAAMVVGWGSKTHYEESYEPEIHTFYSSIECAKKWEDDNGLKSLRPLVVDRSGAIQYASARSIDNTYSKIVKISIIHIR